MTKEQLIKSAKFNLETLQMLNISLQKHIEGDDLDIESIWATTRAMNDHLELLIRRISDYSKE